jgi:hypothetical protein
MNYGPDTWFAGPDPNLQVGGQPFFRTGPDGSRYIQVNFSGGFTGIPGTLLSADSVNLLPAARPYRRTFLEIYKDRIYVHVENDTVRMNSWVVLQNGGLDPDSPYRVRVNNADPALTNPVDIRNTPVLTPSDQPNGSPIGFRSRIVAVLDPYRTLSQPAAKQLCPVYEPASPFRNTVINSYWGMFQSGKAYAVARAEDADGALDGRITNPVALADLVDWPVLGGTAEEIALRTRVLTFYVNKSPILGRTSPRPDTTITTRDFSVVLPATDEDPYDSHNLPSGVGGPSESVVLRRTLTLKGKNLDDRDTTWTDPQRYYTQVVLNWTVPCFFKPGRLILQVQLCDCSECEQNPGQGRCVVTQIPLNYTYQCPAPLREEALEAGQRPGPTGIQTGSKGP